MENLHIKLDFEEARNSKKTLLSTEINILNIARKIEAYQDLRKKELTKKIELKAKLKKLSEDIKKLRDMLPKAKFPEEDFKHEIVEKTSNLKLENELKEIREKLKSLD